MVDIHISPNAFHLAETVALHFIWLGNEAISRTGRFTVALAGGSTPTATYKLLSTPEFLTLINWYRVYVFWGDERCVPPEHPDSNYRTTKETLLDHVPIPPGNVHRIKGELEPQSAATDYENQLKSVFGDHPQFDLVLLGMGEDGHTASLFPGTAVIHEQEHWVTGHFVDKLDSWRITLTPAILNQAWNINFLVSGESKAGTLQQVLHGPHNPDLLPSQVIAPVQGNVTWLVDKAAAGSLNLPTNNP
jgi:6-phosphogluconolactonase